MHHSQVYFENLCQIDPNKSLPRIESMESCVTHIFIKTCMPIYLYTTAYPVFETKIHLKHINNLFWPGYN